MTVTPSPTEMIGATSMFASTIIVAAPVFLVLFLCFCALRSRNPVVYAPNTMEEYQKEMPSVDPESLKVLQGGDSFFTVLGKTWNYSLDEVEAVAGFDAVAFLQLLWGCFQVCLYCLPIAAVLIPIYYTDNFVESQAELGSSGADTSPLNLITLSNVGKNGWRLWVGFVIAYILYAVALWTLRKTYRELAIRVDRFNSKQNEGHHTVCIYDIQEDLMVEGALEKWLGELFPEEVVNVDFMKNVAEVYPKWTALKKAESDLQSCEEAESKTIGMCCFKKDLDQCKKAVEEAQAEFDQYTWGGLEAAPVAFVQFRSLVTSSLAANLVLTPGGFKVRVRSVPDPQSIYYQNLHVEHGVRQGLTLASNIVYILLIIVFSALISSVTLLANIENLAAILGPLSGILDADPSLRATISGLLPVIVFSVFFAILPIFLVAMEHITKPLFATDVQGTALLKYSDCLIGMGLLLSAITSGIFSQLSTIEQGVDPMAFFNAMGTTVPANSMFYIDYVVSAAFITLGLECSMIIPLVLSAILGPSHAYFDYYKKYAVAIMMFAVTSTYVVISPFILVWGTIYFFLAYLIFKYQLMFVYKPGKDTGAKSFPGVYGRLHGGLLIGQVVLIMMYIIKAATIAAPLLVFLPIITYTMASKTNALYRPYFFLPSLQTIRGVEMESKQTVKQGESGYVPDFVKALKESKGAVTADGTVVEAAMQAIQ